MQSILYSRQRQQGNLFDHILQIMTEDGYYETLDRSDEDHSNWMIFVRPANKQKEQNLIAYQEDGYIFYVSLKVRRTSFETFISRKKNEMWSKYLSTFLFIYYIPANKV